MGTPLGTKYVPDTYMDSLGYKPLTLSARPPTKSRHLHQNPRTQTFPKAADARSLETERLRVQGLTLQSLDFMLLGPEVLRVWSLIKASGKRG